MKRFYILAGVLGLSVASAQTAPFGLNLGMKVDDLRLLGAKPIDNAPGRWDLLTPPTPNSNFSGYLLTATPKQGLCRIAALGVTLKNDASGEQARSKYNDLVGIITQKYGKPTSEYDYLDPKSIWNGRSDFAMAINKDERTLESYWLNISNPSIKNIMVAVRSLSSTDTYVNVIYELNNFTDCSAELKSKSGDGM